MPTGCAWKRKLVTTPKLPPPPQSAQKRSGCFVLARGHEAAVGEDHVRFEQVVDGEAVLAREVARPAAEGEARDAGGRDDAEGHRQAERVRGVIHVARRAAGIHPDRAARRIHAHALHLREVDHQAVVAAAEAGAVVAAAPDRDEKALVAAEGHRGDDVGDVHAARDEARLLVDHPVIERAGGVVVGVAGLDQLAAQGGAKGLDRLVGGHGFLARCDGPDRRRAPAGPHRQA